MLTRFVTHFQKINSEVKLLVQTSDGSEDEFSDFKEVLGLPNSISSEIQSLAIKAYKENSLFVSISIISPRRMALDGKSVLISISGECKNEVATLYQEMLSILESSKRSLFYSFPAQLPYWGGTFVIVIISYLIVWILVSTSTYSGLPKVLEVSGTVYLLIIGLLLILPFIAITKLYSYLFPTVEFLIGAGRRRHKDRETARKLLSPAVLLLVPIAVRQLESIIRTLSQ